MALESILGHILKHANVEAGRIIEQARLSAEDIIKEAKKEAETIHRERIDTERALCEKQKQGFLVNARLDNRKNLLFAKQEMINQVFDRLKSEIAGAKLNKQLVMHDRVSEVAEDMDFYLDRIKTDYEAEAANILFE